MGRGGGCQVVGVLTFCSDKMSLNPAEVYIFLFGKIVEKPERERDIREKPKITAVDIGPMQGIG